MGSYDPTGIITAGINFAGSMASNQINAERAASDMATYLNLVRKQRDWQKEDQQWSEDLTKRLMGYQNEYNTPAQQMKRFAGAGLNPYLALQGGELGSGNSQSVPSVLDPSRGSVSPFQRSPLDNPFTDATSKLLQGASIANQRLAGLAALFESSPKLFNAVGKERFDGIMSSVLGESVDSSIIKRVSDANAIRSESESKIAKIESDLAAKYGETKASNFVALQEQEFNKMAAEIGKMSSDRAVNDATINKMASEYLRNLADAYKLRKEGDKYVIEGSYLNALIGLTSEQISALSLSNLLSGASSSEVRNYLGSRQYEDRLKGAYDIQSDINSDRWIQAIKFASTQIFHPIGDAIKNGAQIGAGAAALGRP